MITIGATGEDDKIREYSSTGPVTWEAINEYKDFPYDGGAKTGLVRPDVCGPSEVPSTSMTGSGYTQGFGGTSSATPHIAGVAALVLQAKPNLSPAQMTEVLQMSAVKVENEFNNKCGAGRVDVQAAIDYARSKF
jgi:serine protease AprX